MAKPKKFFREKPKISLELSTDFEQGTELFFGLIGAVGTDTKRVAKELEKTLFSVGFSSDTIHLIDLVYKVTESLVPSDLTYEKKYHQLMTKGTDFRKKLNRNDALALLSIMEIRDLREKQSGKPNIMAPKRAYILRSLKNADEIALLRKVYGPAFYAISAYSPKEVRIDNLANLISKSYKMKAMPKKSAVALAEKLVERDLSEKESSFGQKVQKAFPEGDAFIDARDETRLRESMQRFIEILFRHPYHSPSRDEYGMFQAKASALRSCSLARQVGAAISTSEGEILSLGTNEVPKFSGGTYWPDSNPDHRDHKKEHDPSDKHKREILFDILERLKKANWLNPTIENKTIESLAEEALIGTPTFIMDGALVLEVIEYGRCVHAEMGAILGAARRGIPIQNSTLYTTTFPCHDCARHVVGAGIIRVVYIEPYPKSKAQELHEDSIIIDPDKKPHKDIQRQDKVYFEPFVGIAPRRYMELFTMEKRKTKDCSTIDWEGREQNPKVTSSFSTYFPKEDIEHKTIFKYKLLSNS